MKSLTVAISLAALSTSANAAWQTLATDGTVSLELLTPFDLTPGAISGTRQYAVNGRARV